MSFLDHWTSERRDGRDPLTGTRLVQLTAQPADHFLLANADSSLSPSGETLLFTSTRAGPALDLFRLEMATGAIVQVTETDRLDRYGVTPAADGRRAIARLNKEDGEMVAIDLETGEWETLAVFPEAALDGCHLSASGEYVVTVVSQGNEVSLTAVHTEGMRTVPILQDLPGATAPRFSPDLKNSVLYSSSAVDGAIRCVEFDGSDDRVLNLAEAAVIGLSSTDGVPTGASWLGNGEAVIFIAGPQPGPIMAAPRHGGRPSVLWPGRCRWARSAPAGDRVVAVGAPLGGQAAPASRRNSGPHQHPNSDRSDPRSIPAHEIVLLNPGTGAAARLCAGRSGWIEPCISPDGRMVLFADRDSEGYFQIYLALPDGGGE